MPKTKRKIRKGFSLSPLTVKQIEWLSDKHGISQSEVVDRCVDRVFQAEQANKKG